MQSKAGARPCVFFAILCSGLMLFAMPTVAYSQAEKSTSHSTQQQQSSDRQSVLADQLRVLQAKVAQLEAMLKQKHAASMSSGAPSDAMKGMAGMQMGKGMSGMGMKSMSGMGGGGKQMGMMGQGMSDMGSMSGMGMGGMQKDGMSGMKMMGKGMAMMGKMKGQMQMQTPSALPGFPGASHIYHIGSTAFFLDHENHITLSVDQQTRLNEIKEKSLLEQGTLDRQIDEAEQELWVLTSSDSPDIAQIERTVRAIEKLTGDKRVAFIRSVGDAAKVLTDEQRQVLIGTLPPEHTAKPPQ